MDRPLIGITCAEDPSAGAVRLAHAYYRAVAASGGAPVLMPPLVEILEDLAAPLDGLLLSGGGDPDPWLYGEEPRPGLGSVEPKRDRFELELTRLVLARGIPVLGICRGMQVLNVAAGGTLWQDIGDGFPGALKHNQDAPRWYPTHAVATTPKSLLSAILERTNIRVNSFHHQAVRRLAPGFVATAVAPDGVIEGLEGAGDAFAIGVQWHPEAMFEQEPLHSRLFAALVTAAGKRRDTSGHRGKRFY